MTLSSNQLINHIEALLTVCKDILGSEDAIQLQTLKFSFKHVKAEDLLLIEICKALSTQITDDNVLSYFRMLLRHVLIESKTQVSKESTSNIIENLQVKL